LLETRLTVTGRPETGLIAPDSSNLMMMLDWKVPAAIRMPRSKKQLSICDRDAIRAWIREGAKNN